MSPLKAGDQLGVYHLEEEIGFGGMGVVYRARDMRLERDVAVKVLAPWLGADQESQDALLREARMASSLNNPHICTVHEVGTVHEARETDHQVYIVMELIEGQTLGELIPENGLPVSRVLHYALQIADALAEAHDRGVIHRDLKANNVMIRGNGRVKVLDFGIAIRRDPNGPVDAADRSGELEGTLVYTAPEQLQGRASDRRSDLWSFGVLLYEMCAGRRPFEGRTPEQITEAILHEEPAPLPERVPPTLRGVIMRCLQKDPALRYGRAGEAQAALEIAQHDSSGRPLAGAAAPAAPTAQDADVRTESKWWPGRRRGILSLTILLLAAAAIAWLLRGGVHRPDDPRSSIRSLAVLPLENLSNDPEQEYFVDGMTDELIATLATMTPLQIISRTSAMRYKGTTLSLPQIARELHVDAVIEGSVTRVGNRVRVTAQLIDAASDQHLWARSFERDMEDVLALQGDVAREIAGELHMVLQPGMITDRVRRIDPQAFEATLRGRFHMARMTAPDLEEAVRQFQMSIERDPNDASAWAGLASAHALLHTLGAGQGTEELMLAGKAADHAIEIDPRSADAQTAHGQVEMLLWNWSEAETGLKRAIEFQPANAEAHYWYSQLLLEQARLPDALTQIELAVRSDPLSQACSTGKASILAALGRRDEAMTEIQRAMRLDPSFSRTYLEQLDILHALGKLAEAAHAIAMMDSVSGVPPSHAAKLVNALQREGPKAYWNEAARQLITHEGGRVAPAFWTASCLAQGGQTDQAFVWLTRSVDRHEFPGLRWHWSWKPLRDDPRFKELLVRMGLG